MTDMDCLTQDDLPLSPIFIDFLARFLDQSGFVDEKWFDQLSESLLNPGPVIKARARARLERLILDDTAQAAIAAVYRWFREIATGRTDALDDLHRRFRFIAIVGVARTGGSYLTGELFTALGWDVAKVPAVIAHDGFPDVQPGTLVYEHNQWINCLFGVSEYLAMIEAYFGTSSDSVVVVPKKLTKGIYAGSLFNTVLGAEAEYVITIRHPLATCISTYEKSGGLPTEQRFAVRSNIETWIKRDQLFTGLPESALSAKDYFENYIRYWEQYYINLAMSGLTANRSRVVVPFGMQYMEEAAGKWHQRFGVHRPASAFRNSRGSAQRHPFWIERSEEAMRRVASVWQLVDLPFPEAELRECH
jgi:hypothetical protein